jgi:hypothetical protein
VTTGTGDPTSVVLDGARQPQTDDVLVIIHGNDWFLFSNMATPTVGGSSTGVVAITNGSIDNGENAGHFKSYTYVVTSTGDLTVAVDETGDATEEKVLAVYVLSGVDTATPIDIAGRATGTGTEAAVDAPSVAPTSSDAYLICHMNNGPGSSGAMAPPSGMAETYDVNVAGAMATAGAVLQLSASGATGVKSFTATATNQQWVALSIAVLTGAPAEPPPELEEGPQMVIHRSNLRLG